MNRVAVRSDDPAPDDQETDRWAAQRWSTTLRLSVIRLADSAPLVILALSHWHF